MNQTTLLLFLFIVAARLISSDPIESNSYRMTDPFFLPRNIGTNRLSSASKSVCWTLYKRKSKPNHSCLYYTNKTQFHCSTIMQIVTKHHDTHSYTTQKCSKTIIRVPVTPTPRTRQPSKNRKTKKKYATTTLSRTKNKNQSRTQLSSSRNTQITTSSSTSNRSSRSSSTSTSTTTSISTSTVLHRNAISTSSELFFAPIAMPTQSVSIVDPNNEIEDSDSDEEVSSTSTDNEIPIINNNPHSTPDIIGGGSGVTNPVYTSPPLVKNNISNKALGIGLGVGVGCIAALGLAGLLVHNRKKQQEYVDDPNDVSTRWRPQSFMGVVATVVSKLPRSPSQRSRASSHMLANAAMNYTSKNNTNPADVPSLPPTLTVDSTRQY
ncbi:hypothetical protein BDB01DRAFT_793220 [Pilobolus umbonatus]|nr:hypothetical protein BDB01DRAFT_793220 [Pilobolus umbonatus]